MECKVSLTGEERRDGVALRQIILKDHDCAGQRITVVATGNLLGQQSNRNGTKADLARGMSNVMTLPDISRSQE
jgi:hypothetical protein